MDNLPKIKNAVAAIRVSSTKQGLQGDSPKDQREQIEQFAKSHNINVKKYFVFIESASKEVQPVQEAIDYCKEAGNDIQLFIVKSIDRFTRGGSYLYDHLKNQLDKYGVDLMDIYGIIGSQKINTLEHLGMEFKWSVYSPTKKSEILEAERAKDEIRDILTRMIGSEVRYVRLGYQIGIPPYGYVNEKVETIHGRRVILKPHPEEAKWILKMFELRVRGTMTDQQIVDEINKLGFKSRKRYIRDPKDRTKIIGIKGDIKLNLKQYYKYIVRPVYAGIMDHKWTEGQPVKGQFKGLVSLETFNQANRGKIILSEENGQVKITKRELLEWQTKKCVINPKFPYKKYVMCPVCEKPLFGSASRGHLGKYYPAYHCNKRGHYFRVTQKEFDQTIEKFVSSLYITKEYVEELKNSTFEEWKSRMSEVKDEATIIEERINELDQQAFSITEKIKILSSSIAIKSLEEDLFKIEIELKELAVKKYEKEGEAINIEIVMDKIQYFLEHLEELLLGSSDPLKRAAYFGVLFKKAPTYQELISGTASLEDCIALNEDFKKTKSFNVGKEGVEPTWPCDQ